jgi:CSLREA domain-containing protein
MKARYLFAVLSLLALLGSALTVTPAHAAGSTITVSTTTDEYDNVTVPGAGCSLREAITSANTNSAFGGCTAGTGFGFDPDTITVPAGTYTLTRAGASEDANVTGDLDILDSVTINGAGAPATIIRAGSLGYPDGNANGIDRVIFVQATLAISDLTIANGNCASCIGGGIWNGFGTLTLNNIVFSGNASGLGGAIYNSGDLTINNSTFSSNSGGGGGGAIAADATTLNATNSTFSGNSATYGGGIYLSDNSTATLKNNTFSGNSAGTLGGGIYNDGTLNLANTILADSLSGADCYNAAGDTIATNTQNLIETNSAAGHECGTPAVTGDPMLGPLTSNGGPTETFALLAGSPAIDTGDDTTCTDPPVNSMDQRGLERPQGAHCDIGAYEVSLPHPANIHVYPAQDAPDACLMPHVGTSLMLDALMRLPSGDFDPASVTLKLDDVVHTGDADIAQTGAKPATHASVLYTPPSDLSPGSHKATIIFPSSGGPVTYSWFFTVTDTPCPTSAPLEAPVSRDASTPALTEPSTDAIEPASADNSEAIIPAAESTDGVLAPDGAGESAVVPLSPRAAPLTGGAWSYLPHPGLFKMLIGLTQ